MTTVAVGIGEVAAGTRFQFQYSAAPGPGEAAMRHYPAGPLYVARGGGWYSSPGGSDGGPWHAPALTPVYAYPV